MSLVKCWLIDIKTIMHAFQIYLPKYLPMNYLAYIILNSSDADLVCYRQPMVVEN